MFILFSIFIFPSRHPPHQKNPKEADINLKNMYIFVFPFYTQNMYNIFKTLMIDFVYISVCSVFVFYQNMGKYFFTHCLHFWQYYTTRYFLHYEIKFTVSYHFDFSSIAAFFSVKHGL